MTIPNLSTVPNSFQRAAGYTAAYSPASGLLVQGSNDQVVPGVIKIQTLWVKKSPQCAGTMKLGYSARTLGVS